MTSTERDWLATRFEEHRSRLRAVAYRMLGSLSEADDAVQEAWLRLNRSDASAVDNLGGWLTTVVARLCLDALRTRASRREDSMEVHLPDLMISTAEGDDPEHQAELADSVGLAMLVVLDTLTPAERLAFVLHDTFGLPFDQIGRIVDRSPTAARQLASRARRRVRGSVVPSDVAPERQRELVDAFLAAARAGDFEALLRVLDPGAIARGETGAAAPILGPSRIVRGAEAVARQALAFRQLAPGARAAIVNGTAGLVAFAGDRPFAVVAFTFADDRIIELDILADPERLARLDLAVLRPAW
ncbi:MAG TPA: sigma-70 family RNA polymerase sigma factor [Candidatus Dormibacteraeota bacterium]|nr:sigma-70 family RNA polymerase sigma factor [Candidatus Dormibacteraeota bacterium]